MVALAGLFALIAGRLDQFLRHLEKIRKIQSLSDFLLCVSKANISNKSTKK